MRPSSRLLSSLADPARRNTVGFIGLGQMGREMANNLFSKTALAAGAAANVFEGKSDDSTPHFVVCDPVPTSTAAFVQAFSSAFPTLRISVADTPSEVAKQSSRIFSMLPSSPQVKDVYLGETGIVKGLQALGVSSHDTLCVDSTTLDIDVAKDVASQINSAGANMVDAPVSGGVVGAKAATLSFMVGGPYPSFELARPYLVKMGKSVTHCGGPGTGLAVKLCNNHILGINQVAVAEAMLLGISLGLSPALLASVINNSTGKCWPSEVNNPVPGALPDKSPPCERGYEGGFAARLMLKDMLLAAHAAETVSVPIPVGEKAAQVYDQLNTHREGELGTKDFSVVFEYLRRMSTSSS